MNRLRENFATRPDNRAGDLRDADPIAWAEELQTQPERGGLNWHVLIGWPVMIAVGVAAWWLLFALFF